MNQEISVNVKDRVVLRDGREGKVVALLRNANIQIKYKKKVITVPLEKVAKVL